MKLGGELGVLGMPAAEFDVAEVVCRDAEEVCRFVQADVLAQTGDSNRRLMTAMVSRWRDDVKPWLSEVSPPSTAR